MKRSLTVMAATLLLLAGCGSDEEPEASPSPSATQTTQSPEPEATETARADHEVEVTIKDGKATPQGERIEVGRGESILIEVTSDMVDEIHVHADPEQTIDAVPDEVRSVEFSIGTPGQYAVESHELGVTIAQLVVR